MVNPDGACQLDGLVKFEFVADFTEENVDTVTLTSCGAIGGVGPTDCSNALSKVQLPTGIDVNMKPSNGVQEVTFTEDGIWEITAGGALGGFHVGVLRVGTTPVPTLQMGGAGATAQGTFKFKKGKMLCFVPTCFVPQNLSSTCVVPFCRPHRCRSMDSSACHTSFVQYGNQLLIYSSTF
jgi:hypothetical protein